MRDLFVAQRVETTPGVFVTEWTHLGSWVAPTEQVPIPDPALGHGPELTGDTTYEVAWNEAPAQHEHDNVAVEWWVDSGSGFGSDGIDTRSPTQQRGASRVYDVNHDVYCRLWYYNDAGSGPTVDTNTA